MHVLISIICAHEARLRDRAGLWLVTIFYVLTLYSRCVRLFSTLNCAFSCGRMLLLLYEFFLSMNFNTPSTRHTHKTPNPMKYFAIFGRTCLNKNRKLNFSCVFFSFRCTWRSIVFTWENRRRVHEKSGYGTFFVCVCRCCLEQEKRF